MVKPQTGNKIFQGKSLHSEYVKKLLQLSERTKRTNKKMDKRLEQFPKEDIHSSGQYAHEKVQHH